MQSPFASAGTGGATTRSFGNAIIVQENPATDGTFTPDDDGSGGVLSFSFDTLIELRVLSLLDVRQGTTVTLFNDANEVLKLSANSADTNTTLAPTFSQPSILTARSAIVW